MATSPHAAMEEHRQSGHGGAGEMKNHGLTAVPVPHTQFSLGNKLGENEQEKLLLVCV